MFDAETTMIDDLTDQDRLDSRDLEQLILDLEAMQEDCKEQSEADGDPEAIHEFDEGYGFLLDTLRALRADVEDEGWHDGIQFVRNSDFVEFAQEWADDLGLTDGAEWPNNHINWEAAAAELAMDYSLITINRVDFWYREA